AQRQLSHVLPPLLHQLPVHPVRVPQRPVGQRGAQVAAARGASAPVAPPAGLQQPVQLPQLADLLGRRVAGAVADEGHQLHGGAGVLQQFGVPPRRLGVRQQPGVGILVAGLGTEVVAERRNRGVLRLQEGAARERREQRHSQGSDRRHRDLDEALRPAEHGAARPAEGDVPAGTAISGSGGQGAGPDCASGWVWAPRIRCAARGDAGVRTGNAGARGDSCLRLRWHRRRTPGSFGDLRLKRSWRRLGLSRGRASLRRAPPGLTQPLPRSLKCPGAGLSPRVRGGPHWTLCNALSTCGAENVLSEPRCGRLRLLFTEQIPGLCPSLPPEVQTCSLVGV
uniref:Uncharacterized protein n=1 Tax=Mustela putorius furo TaxID=9669 RepID=M3Z8U4_MUSPF